MCASMANRREDDAHFNDEENDVESDEDLESLRKACALTGTDFNSLNGAAYNNKDGGADGDDSFVDSESEDDMELVKSIQKRFSSADWTLQPHCSLPPVLDDDDNDDDFQTLCAVKRRFAAFDDNDYMRDKMGTIAKSKEQGDALAMEQTGNLSMDGTDESFRNSEEVAGAVASVNDSSTEIKPSSFPKFAQAFLDAIKRNRSCQKLLRSKMIQIELKMEENKKMRDRVKVLKDLQLRCKKLTGQALALRKDPRIQLISSRRASASCNESKVNDKIVSAARSGPMENSQVAKYRMALTNFPLSLHRKKWTQEEKNKLEKGLRQQIQQIMFQCAVDYCDEGSYGDTNILDNVLGSIRDFNITPEKIREFLPKVDWDKLASMHNIGRSGAECEQQWLNFEDPLINHGQWSSEEDKTLLFIVQEKGVTNWFDIAISLGTNRTPSQCLARFQRSLNARILKREWTEEEDAQLRTAVETFGEHDWQSVASVLGGRTGPQCSNRWKKTLHPDRKIVGRWRADEDKRLKVAVKLFGPRNWNKIANFVPGRTHVQCRERWTNSLDPSLNRNKWTEEEDSKLLAAVEEYGHCWSKVASRVPGRTDNHCWRRWKVLAPHEVPLLQAARKLQKAALIGNFVDRESERPRLGPNDFVQPKMIECPSGSDQPTKNKRRRGCDTNAKNCCGPDNGLEKLKPKRRRKGLKNPSEESPGTTAELNINSGNSVEIFNNSQSLCLLPAERLESGKTLWDLDDSRRGSNLRCKQHDLMEAFEAHLNGDPCD